MRARTTWLSEAEKGRIVDQALELLAGVGMRFAGSAAPAPARGARRERGRDDGHRAPAARARGVGGRAVPAQHPDGRPHRGGRRPAGRGRALPLLAQRLRRQDARLPHRRAPRQHAAGRARGHGAASTSCPKLDIMWTQVSASDVPLEQRELTEYFTLLTETRKHVTFVDCPTEVDAVVRLCEALAGDLDRFRARPRISTVCHRRVSAPGRRRAPRRARRARAHRRARSRSTR